MEIFGIGPLEFLLIVVLMLLVLGPKEMVATAGKIGRFIRQVVRSPIWGTVMQTSKEVRDLPTKIMREAGLEQEIAQIKEVAKAPSQMMSEAVKQLKVEIDPIEFPKIPNPLASSTLSTTAAPVQASPSPASLSAAVAATAPLEIEPVEPVSIDPSTPTVVLESQETQIPIQADIEEIIPPPPDGPDGPLIIEPAPHPANQVSEEAHPLEVDSFELPTDNPNDLQTAPAPKRRTRRPKTDVVSSTPDQAAAQASDSPDQVTPLDSNEPPQPVRKTKRTRVKPTPLEIEPIGMIETVAPHENGGSAKAG